MKPRKYPKLRGRARSLASKYIAEEERTRQYPRKQAIAIGISRAREEVTRDKHKSVFLALCHKYGIRA